MKKVRARINDAKRIEVMNKTGGACYYCGYLATCIDHFVPWSFVANDTLKNLIPACSICNLIAHNRHFSTLADKKEYILKQRNSSKWRRRISRMVKILVHVDANGIPTGVVTEKKHRLSRFTRDENTPLVWEAGPAKKRSKKRAVPKSKRPEVERRPKPLPKLGYRKPVLRKVCQDQIDKEFEIRRYLMEVRKLGITWDSIVNFVFSGTSISTLSDLYNQKRTFRYRSISRLYAMYQDNIRKARWLVGGTQK